MPPPAPASTRGHALGLDPAAVVDDPQLDVAAVDRGPSIATRPRPGAPLDPVSHGVLDQRLHRHRRDDRAARLGRDVDRDVQAVAEPRLLEAQVALDVVELLAERHVGAAVAEQVAGELGEVDQQLARLLGPGVDVARPPRPARCR